MYDENRFQNKSRFPFVFNTFTVKSNGTYVISSDFRLDQHDEWLMVRNGSVYAWRDESTGMWNQNYFDLIHCFDEDLREYAKQFEGLPTEVKWFWKASSGAGKRFNDFIKNLLIDNWRLLDQKVIFQDTEVTWKDYCSKRLPYVCKEGPHPAWDEMMDTHFSKENRDILEWAIGVVMSGDIRKTEKFVVIEGSPKSGKGTFLDNLKLIFDGKRDCPESEALYTATIDFMSLCSSQSQFATEPLRNGPLVAIQFDGRLDKIDLNERLNTIVSHETILINPKGKTQFPMEVNAMLFLGTNRPVKITDANAGIIRRLLDPKPTGDTIPPARYRELQKQIEFELGAIAYHCIRKYKEMGPDYYDDYVPTRMIAATNDFYDFIDYKYDAFISQDPMYLDDAFAMYDDYCAKAGVPDAHKMKRRVFKLELTNYYTEYKDRTRIDGRQVRSVYYGFKKDKFAKDEAYTPPAVEEPKQGWLIFNQEFGSGISAFNEAFKDCFAQYEVDYNGKRQPQYKWANVRTLLRDIFTDKVHYVKVPPHVIMIDFDIPGEDGKKDFQKNLEAASKWPETYAELSKSGAGIHLYYYYYGDLSLLEPLYAEHIEVKTFPKDKDSAIRRRLSRFNDRDISVITSGLPLKKGGKKNVITEQTIKDAAHLRNLILKGLRREIASGSTTDQIDFIKHVTDQAYESGMEYDVSEFQNDIYQMACTSHNQAPKCVEQYHNMHLRSKEPDILPETTEEDVIALNEYKDKPLVFYDCESPRNHFVICAKESSVENPNWHWMVYIDPTPQEAKEFLMSYRLVGHNCRKYDNHEVGGISLGDDAYQAHDRSNMIINNKTGFISQFYNASYADTLEFPTTKQSLKKHECEMGLPHMEMDIDWDTDVTDEQLEKIIEYCKNDVLATEAVFYKYAGDFAAREFQAELSGLTTNDICNTHTTRILLGKDANLAKKYFRYRDLSKPVLELDPEYDAWLDMLGYSKDFTAWDGTKSKIPCFPGYEFIQEPGKKKPVSRYRGFEVGEGGWVWAKPGMYENVTSFDITSAHVTNMELEMLFGKYTKMLHELKVARVFVKHGDFESAGKLMDGRLKPFLKKEHQKALSTALKLSLNSVYGLTSAKFDNPFKDPRNVDNIVAKRTALYMVDLYLACIERGYEVVHIKTDSIKIANPPEGCAEFIFDFAKRYGYAMEVEHVFRRFCLVNDAVYIARIGKGDPEEPYNKWTATGTEFDVPYIFKTLFSHEPIEFKDLCLIKQSHTGNIYLDMNEGLADGEHSYAFIGRVGLFCPIMEGHGGGLMYAKRGEKYYAVGGTKGWRWMEAEDVQAGNRQDSIDYGYFDHITEEAKEHIKEFETGYKTWDWFIADEDDPLDQFMNVPEGPDEVPFDI